ncbi:hypothetical protein [Sinobaca sp. H24]|uniref:hypothetical protein n=1 Tax=Sinobaca sp. H24 TaxID=2923376 RepID=UPI00207AF610|nr:hypothetical protein [Sinobaca sp. H24]
MNNRKKAGFLCFIPLLLLGGCFYPNSGAEERQGPDESQIAAVQQAVDQYREDEVNLLPIRTPENNPPLYERYVIDFRQLMPRYMQEPPANSFESGGSYQYMIIDPEEEAEVKVIDLRMTREIREFEQRVSAYIAENEFAPIKESVAPGIFEADLEKLEYEERPTVASPYFNTSLPLLINADGEALVDYSIDINRALQVHEASVDEGEDARTVLVEHYPVVPAFSGTYELDENGEPVLTGEEEPGQL